MSMLHPRFRASCRKGERKVLGSGENGVGDGQDGEKRRENESCEKGRENARKDELSDGQEQTEMCGFERSSQSPPNSHFSRLRGETAGTDPEAARSSEREGGSAGPDEEQQEMRFKSTANRHGGTS